MSTTTDQPTTIELTIDDRVLIDLTSRFGCDAFGISEAYPGGGLRGVGVTVGKARASIERLVRLGGLRRVEGTVRYEVTADGFDWAYMRGARHEHMVTVDVNDLVPGDRVVWPNGLAHAVVNRRIDNRRVRFFTHDILHLDGPVRCWPIWSAERGHAATPETEVAA